MVNKDDVLDALRSVTDPELHKDLVTLNMIREIEVDGGRVAFTLNLTTPACPLRSRIEQEARAAVASIKGVSTVEMKVGAQVAATHPFGESSVLKNVKNIIAVASGKGGVGKSTVAVNLALALSGSGAKVGILDADIYGPNIPLMMGVNERPSMRGDTIIPLVAHGVKVASLGFFYKDETALVWRGPMVAGAVKQLLTQVDWGDLDYLVVDLPPGTGDSGLTLAQTVPLGGVVIVTTPQEAALNIATKAVGMFRKLNVPILGIVENMSYFVCPHCLPPDQKVITANGLTPISEVSVGDMVLTHKGRFRRVSDRFEREFTGQMVEIGTKSAGAPEFQVTLTEDHPILTRHLSHRKDGNFLMELMWEEAAKVQVAKEDRSTNLVAFPRIVQTEDKERIEFSTPYYHREKKVSLSVGPDLMSLLGYYLAEGSIIEKKGRGICAIRFTFGNAEKELRYATELTTNSSRLGFRPNLYKGKTGWRVEISSVVLARWLAREFGRGAKYKRVPYWVVLLPPEKLQWLFETYINGDGHRTKIETNAVTVSLQLAASIRDIGLKLGFLPSITVREGNPLIQGRVVRASKLFRIGFTLSKRTRFDKDYVYLRVKNVRRFPFSGKVYNLSVEEDNSYCTPYQVVHNCGEKSFIFSSGGGRKASALLDVQFLGEIPLYPRIREQSDLGVPIVVAAPDSPESLAFKDVAFRVAGMISMVAYNQSQ